MSTVAVTVRRVEPRADSPRPVFRDDLERDLELARKFAVLLDSQFSFAGIRFGIDGIIGLIPAIGDFVGVLLGLYLLRIAHKHRLGKGLLVLMALNLGIEWILGLFPVLGDFLDIAFKANLRNFALLEKAVARRRNSAA